MNSKVLAKIYKRDREIPHQMNKYIKIEELAETTAIYREAALRFLGGNLK